MSVYRRLFLLIMLSLALPVASNAEIDNSWLVGTWISADNSKQESLEFTVNKTVSLSAGKGQQIDGDYQLTDSAVKIVYNFKGKKIPIELNYSAAKDSLSGNLSNTGKTVKYTKK